MSVQARSRRASRRAFICGVVSLGKDAAIPCETGLAAKRSPTRYQLHNEWRGTLATLQFEPFAHPVIPGVTRDPATLQFGINGAELDW